VCPHSQEKFRYKHLERMNETVVRLPLTPAKEPDWKFMRGYIKSLQQKHIEGDMTDKPEGL